MRLGRGWGTAAILALLAGGCSNVPKNMVVLLDQPDGRPSAVIFKSKTGGTQVVDKPGLATGVDSAGEKPRDPFQLEREEFNKRFAGALGAAPVPPRSFQLYFKFDSTDLTDESRAQLPKILEEMKSRPAPEVTVIGHTDTVGTQAHNYELGLKRALATKQQIIGIGVDPTRVDVTSHGKLSLLVPTADNVSEPRNRRVEVTVR
jgi:outer membrane protein OmpA-like peptidoglycan-associated protein